MIDFDCPYCGSPTKKHKYPSTTGCFSQTELYNGPESWHYEICSYSCGNGHAHVNFGTHEYYYRQFSNYEEYKKATENYTGPRTKIGYIPYGVNNMGFDGTIHFAQFSMGFVDDHGTYIGFSARSREDIFGYHCRTPYITIHDAEDEFSDNTVIEVPMEWLSLSPDQIISEMKKVLSQ